MEIAEAATRGPEPSRFVGEQASLKAILKRQHNTRADRTTKSCLTGKRAGDDGYDGIPQIGTVHADDNKAAGNVEDGHDGNQLLAHLGNLLQAADDNDGNQDGNHNANKPRGDFGGTGNQA